MLGISSLSALGPVGAAIEIIIILYPYIGQTNGFLSVHTKYFTSILQIPYNWFQMYICC